MTRFLTVTASTKRSPAIAGGKRGAPATKIASLKCTPLDPVDPELRQRLALNTPNELLETFVAASEDVVEGDFLVVSGNEYPIRSCSEWTWKPGMAAAVTYKRLVLEDLKR